ncbi:MAG: Ig-like domain-containing protein [Christensenellales bacterium]|jgi:uncharacterized protein YjdB
MTKRILTALLALLFVLLAAPLSVLGEGDVQGLLCSDGEIYDYGGMQKGEPVAKDTVTHLYIDDGITNIDDTVLLECTQLQAVTIPRSVTSIHDDAFSACTVLQKIYAYTGSAAAAFATDKGYTLEVLAENITLNHTRATIYTGKTLQLSAESTPAGAVVAYTSSKPSVAKVDPASGLVTGVKAGTATITAALAANPSVKQICEVTVKQLATSVSLNKTSMTIYVGKSEKLTATVLPNDASNKGVTYKSSNTSIATVTTAGTVKGLKVGKATITVTAKDGSGKKKTCTVNVKLAQPVAKAVTASLTSVKLTWGKVAGAAKYEIYRSTKSTSGYKKIATVTGTSYTASKLTAGTTYYFRVRALAPDPSSYITSKTVSARGRLSTPKVASASATNKQVSIKWGKVAGAGGYYVYRSTSKNGTYSRIATVKGGASLSYIDKTISPSKTYYYKIRAYYSKASAANSLDSNPKGIVTKPNTPGSLKAAASGKTGVKLTWKKTITATGYQIYRASSKGGKYSLIKTISGNSTLQYTDQPSLSKTTTFYYKIRSYKTVGGKNYYGSASSAVGQKVVKYYKGSSDGSWYHVGTDMPAGLYNLYPPGKKGGALFVILDRYFNVITERYIYMETPVEVRSGEYLLLFDCDAALTKDIPRPKASTSGPLFRNRWIIVGKDLPAGTYYIARNDDIGLFEIWDDARYTRKSLVCSLAFTEKYTAAYYPSLRKVPVTLKKGQYVMLDGAGIYR